ncbi:FecR family protein [Flavihumibacter solisilvae]|uniref:Iron dicitrate transport regulator FecR n=1 Tax=Flavihumibacter solisilvae TaxID=1349421 RepID=A0A0C1LFE4_9BACT|nr:FecR family protein [Flavihumibacter solisilvae]KIC94053.1 hypothetical protein OI18_13675 [Flavihumibacter solisilvae]
MDKIDSAIRYGRMIARHLQGELTPAEQEELQQWLGEDENNHKLLETFHDEEFVQSGLSTLHSIDKNEAWDKISRKLDLPISIRRRPGYRAYWWAAAILLVTLSAGGWFLLQQSVTTPGTQVSVTRTHSPAEILPGTDKATLTLSDGTTINLDSAQNGQLASQGAARILKHEDGSLVYKVSGKTGEEIIYNTVSTPRGGQYRLTLPDGSRVWLNAASEIRFPAVFASDERQVEIKGEVYFEVEKAFDKQKRKLPFIVQVNEMKVEVLGTHFNINAYADEVAAKTTLLEGSVKVLSGTSQHELVPGEQANVRPNESVKVLADVDVEEVMAWKDGLFNFSNADIHGIMRQVSRWYDVDVRYTAEVPARTFSGKIRRSANLTNVLMILEKSGIHFKVEGKNIVVSP